jgi:hypothetical protein
MGIMKKRFVGEYMGWIIAILTLAGTLYSTRLADYRNEQGQITDRFTKAVSQLGDPQLSVRVGGIYALERIANDSERDHWAIMKTLAAFIKQHAPYSANDNYSQQIKDMFFRDQFSRFKNDRIEQDIQAALQVIGRRNLKADPKNRDEILDLQNIILSHADLSGLKLSKINFYGSFFYKPNFVETDFNNSLLANALLFKPTFAYAKFKGGIFKGTILYQPHTLNTNLRGADISYMTGWTQEALDKAVGDKDTKLPVGLTIKAPQKERVILYLLRSYMNQ